MMIDVELVFGRFEEDGCRGAVRRIIGNPAAIMAPMGKPYELATPAARPPSDFLGIDFITNDPVEPGVQTSYINANFRNLHGKTNTFLT